MEATGLRLLASSLALVGLACRRGAPPPARPSDGGTMVTVYVPPRLADRVMGRLQRVAARHEWALSVRTDSAALADADLAIVDSAGTLLARLRPGAAAAAQAKVLADAALE